MSTWNELKNPHHDQRDPSTARVVVCVLLFVLLVGAVGVILLHASIP